MLVYADLAQGNPGGYCTTIIVPPQQFITPLYLHLSRFDIFGLIKRINNGRTLNLMSTSFPYFLR